jgi:CRP-like cAMP-binding protein
MNRNPNAPLPAKDGVRCISCPLRLKPAFKAKTPEEIAYIDGLKVSHILVPAGAEIIFPGQADAELFTLFSGWAFREKSLADDRRQILNFLLPGDIVGLQASLLDASEHGIEALTDVELCVFPRRKVWTVFERMPQLAFELSWMGAREQSLVDEAVMSVGQRSARERMAALIMGLYRRLERLHLVDAGRFLFPLSRQHLADALGLSLVHTIKTWSWLRRSGYFTFDGTHMTLTNPRLTERLAQYYESEWQKRPLL